MKCANCTHHNCYKNGQNCTRYKIGDVKSEYSEEDRRIMEIAADIEGNHYMQITRLEESRLFARQYGAKKIGLAFCIGLANEAKLISDFFSQEFTVSSICCKTCGVPKEDFALTQIKPGQRETMCNPKMQAKILLADNVDLIFTIGLCVGHDMLFNAAVNVPCSALITKDRLLAHNPAAALYSRYWRRRLKISGAITLHDD